MSRHPHEILSSALEFDTELPSASDSLNSSFSLEVGQITAIYTLDHPDNNPVDGDQGIYTLYDVEVRGPDGHRAMLKRVKMLQPSFGGGLNNFMEALPTDPGTDAAKPTLEHLKRGHMVLVGYISGKKDNAVILGGFPHTNPTAQKARPRKGKGTYLEGEIQGLNFSIDNDGAMKINMGGPKSDAGSPVNSKLKTTIHIQKDGSLEITTNEKQKIRIDSQTHHIRVDNGPTYIDMDQDGDKIDVVAKNVNVGTGGLQPQIVGDDMVKFLEELLDQVMALYVPTGVGPSGTPVNNPAFAALKTKCKKMIQSTKHKVEK